MKLVFGLVSVVLVFSGAFAANGNCQHQVPAEALATAAKTLVFEGRSIERLKFQAEPAVLIEKKNIPGDAVVETYDNLVYLFEGSGAPQRLEVRIEMKDHGSAICELVRGSMEIGK